MTRITNADQVLIMLRAQLERVQRGRKKAIANAPKRDRPHRTPLERVQQLAAAEGISEAEIGGALIESLLLQEFGPALANDPQFLQVAQEVKRMMRDDEACAHLLKQAVKQLGVGR